MLSGADSKSVQNPELCGFWSKSFFRDLQLVWFVLLAATCTVGEWPPNPFTFPSLRGAQRLCTELPGMARQGQGWVRDPHARHSTMLYSMQEGALSPNSAEGLMKHGRASREAT